MQTLADLSRHLQVNSELLLELFAELFGPDGGSSLYRTAPRMKESGGVRWLDKPRKKLKDVQRIINDRLLQRITVHQSAKGAVRGRTLMDNVRPHVGKPMVAKFDMKDFFPSISSGRVYDFFVQIGCSPDVARLLARLTTYKGRIPQGTPTSPMLAVLVAGYGKKGSYNGVNPIFS
ncbi:MAG: reverse transcriptase family protein [Nitrospinota bacterium]